ncbi:MAG TPA: hypothetical protein VFQ35_24440 [Polyangiaceae bacterium]|nr:hypothetical protein [Polyangiaceae bacterium]
MSYVELRSKRALAAMVAALGLTGCGDRNPAWDTPFVRGQSVGLSGAVAIVDGNRNEAMMLTSPSEGNLSVSRLKVGKNVALALPSADRERLFVLSRGDERRLHERDEKPRLTVIEGGVEPSIFKTYELGDPAQKLVLDPEGRWAIVYDTGGVVVNSNELVLVDLEASEPSAALHSTTLHSTGGQPERFTFTSPLTLPSGERHQLLVVETNQDLSVLDLEQPDKPEVRVSLPKARAGGTAHPTLVAFHDDASASGTGSYLAVGFENDPSVLTLKLGDRTDKSVSGISVVPNLLDSGAIPSTIDFVETDSGLRLAALVPDQKAAVLFDPTTSKSERVEFDKPYTGIARITGVVDDTSGGGDVALLYSSRDATIAFWRLGSASTTPYASYDSYGVDTRVTTVLDIPGEKYGYLKLLTGANTAEFFLLDLRRRESYPMKTLAGFNLSLSPDGMRAWAFPQHGDKLAELTFDPHHPTSFSVERPIENVFDIARKDGGRSALVLHVVDGAEQDLGVTLFDAEHPDSAHTRFFSGLISEGLQ